MADGHSPDVEALRRELATLVLDWAGKAVKDDPDGPLATAMTRAVQDAARSAIIEQHQALSADDAARIAAALEQHRRSHGGAALSRPALFAALAAALTGVSVAFVVGLQMGRGDNDSAPMPPASIAETAAPLAPLAPDDTPVAIAPPARTAAPTAPRPTASAAADTPRRPAAAPPRQLGRPAPSQPASATLSTQPVGSAPTAAPAAPPPPASSGAVPP